MLNRSVPSVDVHEAHRRLTEATAADGGPLLVDVREVNEFLAYRAEQAVLVPLSQLMVRYRELPTDRPLLMICAVGGRSLHAAMFLLSAGWSDVSNVVGGSIAWQAAGLPSRSGPLGGDGAERPFQEGRIPPPGLGAGSRT
jgi:rhodanese-related sulfurtransferase